MCYSRGGWNGVLFLVLLFGYKREYPHHRLLASQHQDTLSFWTADACDREEGTWRRRVVLSIRYLSISGRNYIFISQNRVILCQTIQWFHRPLSETLHTASSLLVYCILKVIAHFIGYFSRNSISNFQKFLKKLQNRTFLKFVPSKHFLITFLVNVQSTWKMIIR